MSVLAICSFFLKWLINPFISRNCFSSAVQYHFISTQFLRNQQAPKGAMPEPELHPPPSPNPNSVLFVLKPPAPAPAPPLTTVKSESPPPPPPNGGGRGGFGPLLWMQSHRPKIRVTSEYDSYCTTFRHRISCKLLDSLAKVKLSFRNNGKGEILEPEVDLTSKYLSLHYDVDVQDAIVKANFDVTPGLQLEAIHHLKSQLGQVAMIADLAGPAYKFELSSCVPPDSLPCACFKFPHGQITLEQKEEEAEDDEKIALSINGFLKGHILNGICCARLKDEYLNLRYCFKDEQVTFVPSISLPSNAVSFAFNRRFGPSDKLSYWYNFYTNYWSAVYKHTAGRDYKFKAGYDSDGRIGWASLWVGDKGGATKTAPMKMKVQFMLQVLQDDIKASAMVFRVKKRWDL